MSKNLLFPLIVLTSLFWGGSRLFGDPPLIIAMGEAGPPVSKSPSQSQCFQMRDVIGPGGETIRTQVPVPCPRAEPASPPPDPTKERVTKERVTKTPLRGPSVETKGIEKAGDEPMPKGLYQIVNDYEQGILWLVRHDDIRPDYFDECTLHIYQGDAENFFNPRESNAIRGGRPGGPRGPMGTWFLNKGGWEAVNRCRLQAGLDPVIGPCSGGEINTGSDSGNLLGREGPMETVTAGQSAGTISRAGSEGDRGKAIGGVTGQRGASGGIKRGAGGGAQGLGSSSRGGDFDVQSVGDIVGELTGSGLMGSLVVFSEPCGGGTQSGCRALAMPPAGGGNSWAARLGLLLDPTRPGGGAASEAEVEPPSETASTGGSAPPSGTTGTTTPSGQGPVVENSPKAGMIISSHANIPNHVTPDPNDTMDVLIGFNFDPVSGRYDWVRTFFDDNGNILSNDWGSGNYYNLSAETRAEMRELREQASGTVSPGQDQASGTVSPGQDQASGTVSPRPGGSSGRPECPSALSDACGSGRAMPIPVSSAERQRRLSSLGERQTTPQIATGGAVDCDSSGETCRTLEGSSLLPGIAYTGEMLMPDPLARYVNPAFVGEEGGSTRGVLERGPGGGICAPPGLLAVPKSRWAADFCGQGISCDSELGLQNGLQRLTTGDILPDILPPLERDTGIR